MKYILTISFLVHTRELVVLLLEKSEVILWLVEQGEPFKICLLSYPNLLHMTISMRKHFCTMHIVSTRSILLLEGVFWFSHVKIHADEYHLTSMQAPKL